MFAQIEQGRAVWQMIAQQFRADGREQNLSAVGNTHNAGGAVECLAIVIAVAQFGLTGVQTHTDAKRSGDPIGFESF